MCDGSSTARLTYQVAGGGLAYPEYHFTGAYGHQFFVIDGTCRYWVGEDYDKGIRTGTLSSAAEEDISKRLHWADFHRLKQPCRPGGIPHTPAIILSDGVNKVSGDCDESSAPEGHVEAFTNVAKVLEQLMAGGVQAALPIQVVSIADIWPAQPVVPWTLSWSPREVLADYHSLTPDAGRVVTDAGEVSALRALRTRILPPGLPRATKVQEAAGDVFLILPRDVAPSNVVDALAALFR